MHAQGGGGGHAPWAQHAGTLGKRYSHASCSERVDVQRARSPTFAPASAASRATAKSSEGDTDIFAEAAHARSANGPDRELLPRRHRIAKHPVSRCRPAVPGVVRACSDRSTTSAGFQGPAVRPPMTQLRAACIFEQVAESTPGWPPTGVQGSGQTKQADYKCGDPELARGLGKFVSQTLLKTHFYLARCWKHLSQGAPSL